jgi:stringent starvation protein B
LRAFYQWIVDSACTPILVIDASYPRCKLPQEYLSNDEVVFNVSPTAIRDLKITNDSVEFKASFSSVVHIISVPVKAILAIYAEENNEGLFFDAENEKEDSETGEGEDENALDDSATSKHTDQKLNSNGGASKNKPFLKLVDK